jgi:hypothetical protein
VLSSLSPLSDTRARCQHIGSASANADFAAAAFCDVLEGESDESPNEEESSLRMMSSVSCSALDLVELFGGALLDVEFRGFWRGRESKLVGKGNRYFTADVSVGQNEKMSGRLSMLSQARSVRLNSALCPEYEPCRYRLVMSHHSSWYDGALAARYALANLHVLEELHLP